MVCGLVAAARDSFGHTYTPRRQPWHALKDSTSIHRAHDVKLTSDAGVTEVPYTEITFIAHSQHSRPR